MLFQVIALLFVGILILLGYSAISRHWIRIKTGIIWLVFWAAGAFFILKVEMATNIANMLGVGRGADLLLYCAVLLFSLITFGLFIRIRRMDENITELIRQLALLEASLKKEETQGEYLEEGKGRSDPDAARIQTR